MTRERDPGETQGQRSIGAYLELVYEDYLLNDSTVMAPYVSLEIQDRIWTAFGQAEELLFNPPKWGDMLTSERAAALASAGWTITVGPNYFQETVELWDPRGPAGTYHGDPWCTSPEVDGGCEGPFTSDCWTLNRTAERSAGTPDLLSAWGCLSWFDRLELALSELNEAIAQVDEAREEHGVFPPGSGLSLTEVGDAAIQEVVTAGEVAAEIGKFEWAPVVKIGAAAVIAAFLLGSFRG